MFEIGFSEIVLLLVIGVIVIGPQRLPEVVRSLVRLKRQFQRHYFGVRDKVNEELGLDKLEQELYSREVQEHIDRLNKSIMAEESYYGDANKYADTGAEPEKLDLAKGEPPGKEEKKGEGRKGRKGRKG